MTYLMRALCSRLNTKSARLGVTVGRTPLASRILTKGTLHTDVGYIMHVANHT